MSKQSKQLSNSFSTGGGGVNFETRVQAAFVVLMMARGFAPCLPPWPIKKIKLQGKYIGFETDDLIVYVKDESSKREAKLLAQVKHSIKITINDPTFSDVIQAAWNDFQNPEIFRCETDVIALVTGPLSATDISSVRPLLESARNSEDVDDFFTRIEMANFSSDKMRTKLKVFQSQITRANNGNDISKEQLWKFLKCFYLLGYDLDIKAGVTLSLLHSLIGQYSSENVHSLWSMVVDEVQSVNQNAGTISSERISPSVREVFTRKLIQTIPQAFVKKEETETVSDLIQVKYITVLGIVNLIGSWSEKHDADRLVIEKLSCSNYSSWIEKIREALLQSGEQISLKNGRWKINERQKTWQALGQGIFDDHLDRFKELAVSVFRERDPQFDLLPEERYAASIHGKVLHHSHSLRKGMAESLALLGCNPKSLTSCSLGKVEITSRLVVREILSNADWVLWGSLNEFLPLFAEAAPDEFLNVVENALDDTPCPFDELFVQEGNGIYGGNYMTGLLWALETLAWNEQFLTRVTVIFGGLAAKDPGGNWANRPSNSLTTIFLPWLPQTNASIEKRITAIKTLLREFPNIAWKTLLSLLPNTSQVSTGSHKPVWRDYVLERQEIKVTHQEYWEQVSGYAELIVNEAKKDLERLIDLVEHFDDLPQAAFEQLLTYLNTSEIILLPEEERFPIWSKLINLVSRHRKFSEAKWAMKADHVEKIGAVAEKLAPLSPTNKHKRLFNTRQHDLYEYRGNWEEQRKELDKRRQNAIREIVETGGVQSVLNFAEVVEYPWLVGNVLGIIAENDVDQGILPKMILMEKNTITQFINGFIRGRYYTKGWNWVDQVVSTKWDRQQIGQLLSYLPFTYETWMHSSELLKEDEALYWTKTEVNPFEAKERLEYAIECLIKYNRPFAAIRCIYEMQQEKQTVDAKLVIRALLAGAHSSENNYVMDVYEIIEVIKSLQDNTNTDPDDLFRVEWAYLSVLDREQGASPKLLEHRLADDSDFFCEVIRIVFRPRNKSYPSKELTKQEKEIATNAYRLLNNWKIPPGTLEDGSFSGDAFNSWLKTIKSLCEDSGHIEVALSQIGGVLIHTPPDPDGLWIHTSVAEALNAKDADKMRSGYSISVFNSRGVYWVDPTGKQERELAAKYREQADAVEKYGYYRFATTLKSIAESYEREAEQNVLSDRFED